MSAASKKRWRETNPERRRKHERERAKRRLKAKQEWVQLRRERAAHNLLIALVGGR